MTLENQLAALRDLGIALEPGITIDDVLYSFSREAYESKPFDLLLFILGAEVEREPWGRPFCSRVWNFDTECIEGDGAYVAIAKQLCRVSGRPDAFSGLRDHVDLSAGEAWIELHSRRQAPALGHRGQRRLGRHPDGYVHDG